jgi:hypothetical protein
MNVRVCNNEHAYGSTLTKGIQNCPVCGLPLFEYELPPHESRGEPVIPPPPAGDTPLRIDPKTPLSVLIAGVLATPEGQRLAYWTVTRVAKKLEDMRNG